MSPLLEIQGLVVSTLKSSASIVALVGSRVIDAVPQKTPLPYISIGPSDLTNVNADCIDGGDFTIQVDAWSDKPGFVEVHQVADAIVRALDDLEVELATNALVFLQHSITRVMKDPAPGVVHAAITFQGVIEVHDAIIP